jgi:ankyrin repeat protein
MKQNSMKHFIIDLIVIVFIGIIPSNSNAQKVTKLFEKGQYEKVEQYCVKQKGEKLKDCNKELGILLMTATLRSEVENVQILLDLGADPNFVNEKDETPLFKTDFPSLKECFSMSFEERVDFYKRKEVIFKMLIDKGADVNATNNNIYHPTPLLSSAIFGSGLNPDIIKLLINSGADIEAVSKYKGETALHLVVKNHSYEAARFLIEAGADINAVLSDGVTTPYLLALIGDKNVDKVNLYLLKVLLEVNPNRNILEEKLYLQLVKVEEGEKKYEASKLKQDIATLTEDVLLATEIIKKLRGEVSSFKE